VKFYCPDCNQKLEAEEEMFGTVIACPVCSENIKVPYPEPDEPETPETPASPGPRPATASVLAAGWTCFGLGAAGLLFAATAAIPLPAPLFLIASCGLGTFAIYRKRKVPGYALVVCAILLFPMSIVFVAHAFAARAEARFGAPSPRATVPSPEPAEPPPGSAQPEVDEDPERHVPAANARRILEPAELPPPGSAAEPEAAAVKEPAETVPEPPAPPERKLSPAERKKIFALFMEADERATREAAKAKVDTDPENGKGKGKGKKSQVQLQRKLAAKYKREIEQSFGLSARQSREILAEGIDADLEELPD